MCLVRGYMLLFKLDDMVGFVCCKGYMLFSVSCDWCMGCYWLGSVLYVVKGYHGDLGTRWVIQ